MQFIRILKLRLVQNFSEHGEIFRLSTLLRMIVTPLWIILRLYSYVYTNSAYMSTILNPTSHNIGLGGKDCKRWKCESMRQDWEVVEGSLEAYWCNISEILIISVYGHFWAPKHKNRDNFKIFQKIGGLALNFHIWDPNLEILPDLFFWKIIKILESSIIRFQWALDRFPIL